MKKRLIRLYKRILILVLCTALVSGSVVNKYKITANATSVVATASAYTLYEICLYVGSLVVTGLGVGYAYENRDELANIGKDFIDWMNIDDVSGWVLTKANTTGQSYVYGTEALQEVKDTTFEVIQGGGNMPENNEDNDGDGDKDFDDRTVELKNLGLWATSSFANLLCEQIQPLLDEAQAGENFVTEILGNPEFAFDGEFEKDKNGNNVIRVSSTFFTDSGGFRYIVDGVSKTNVCCLLDAGVLYFFSLDNGSFWYHSVYADTYSLENDVWTRNGGGTYTGFRADGAITSNIPVFKSRDACEKFVLTGSLLDCINYAKVYQIADWLQEHWTSSMEQLNTGIRSLNDNMLIVGEAANQALINQFNGLGYIEDLSNRIATTAPLALPDSISDPLYYPADSSVPELAPEELPWYTPVTNPDVSPDVGGGSSGSDSVSDESSERGTDSFGLDTLFGILFLLIMIIITLLVIFLSCLAFIIMIFRIPATTGFLPEEMIAGLDYLKSLEIPGLGMSVYSFFMSLIYIILIFSVVGYLRKNIDRIKFPRKGRK